jgi:serine phosphatase RsbU (regulator of sigma subunit)
VPVKFASAKNLLKSLPTSHNLLSQKDISPMGFKEPSFLDRQTAAQNARKNILEKFKAKPAADDPSVLKRAAERQAMEAERAKAQKLKDEKKAAKKAHDAELAAQAAAEVLRLQAEKEAAAEALKAEQKAARDARYAARKKKKK